MSQLTHFDTGGNAVMVDVGGKASTRRRAVASGAIRMEAQTLALVASGTNGKGDVLGIARVAGIQGAKQASALVPLCHPIALTHVSLDLQIDATHNRVSCTAKAETLGPTGVEIEALCAVQVALLTVYDMCKAADRSMVIEEVRLVEKSGGRSGHFIQP